MARYSAAMMPHIKAWRVSSPAPSTAGQRTETWAKPSRRKFRSQEFLDKASRIFTGPTKKKRMMTVWCNQRNKGVLDSKKTSDDWLYGLMLNCELSIIFMVSLIGGTSSMLGFFFHSIFSPISMSWRLFFWISTVSESHVLEENRMQMTVGSLRFKTPKKTGGYTLVN